MPERIELLGQGPPWRRRRRRVDDAPQPLDALPAERRELLARWLKHGAKARWQTLAADAGHAYPLAQALLESLLQNGWVAVTEERRSQAWWPLQVEILDPPALRRALGLPDPQAARLAWQNADRSTLTQPELRAAAVLLDGLPPARALARLHLLNALQTWQTEERSGTRRDFAWFARSDTKAISEAEWNWLSEHCDLESLGVSGHTPHLLIAAPTRLLLQRPGQAALPLPLNASPDWLALTPATLDQLVAAEEAPRVWRLVENRTSFERLSRQRGTLDAVVWLPGFPPSWWRTALARLLLHAPAAAEIACDPDPAGIAIALEAGAVWQAAGLSWSTPAMTAAALRGLPRRKPLTDDDQRQLDRLSAQMLPATLAELALALRELGEKGEQEGYL